MSRWALILSRVRLTDLRYPQLLDVRVLPLDDEQPPGANNDGGVSVPVVNGDGPGDIDEIEITPSEGLDFVVSEGVSFYALIANAKRNHDR